jgi:phosphonate transport system permease protein
VTTLDRTPHKRNVLDDDALLRPPTATRRARAWTTAAFVVILVILAATYPQTQISPAGLVNGIGSSIEFIFGSSERPTWGFFPPDFSGWERYFSEMLLTIAMGIWGTVLCLFITIPLSFAGAQNVAPGWLYQITRRLMDFLRALNELVLALIFVAAVGLGPFPGILALAIGSAGSLGKLLSEAIEAVDPGQVEAVRATGASPLMVIWFGYWPQILPLFLSYTLYRLEINVRAATILGLVGAGGIGFYLQESMRSFDWKATSAILIMIFVTVFIVDFASARLRRSII